MTAKLYLLLQQTEELPEHARAELMSCLVGMIAQELGLDPGDE